MQQIYTEKYRELMESAIPSARGLYPPEILMLDDPTVGVDVEAKNSICHIIASIADSGSGVLLVSSEFDHLSKVCDRILILKKGVITGSLKRGVDDISESALLTAVQS